MLPSILVSTTLQKKTKKNSYKNSRFKISTPIRNGKFELCHELCSVLDIQDYFAKNLSKNIDKNTGKKLSGKSSWKLHGHVKQSAKDALKTALKRVI